MAKPRTNTGSWLPGRSAALLRGLATPGSRPPSLAPSRAGMCREASSRCSSAASRAELRGARQDLVETSDVIAHALDFLTGALVELGHRRHAIVFRETLDLAEHRAAAHRADGRAHPLQAVRLE